MTRMVDGRVEHPNIPGQTSMLPYLEMLGLTEYGDAHRPGVESKPGVTPASSVLGGSVEIIPVNDFYSSATPVEPV